MSRVAAGLYVGGAEEAFDPAVVSRVTHVLNVASELDVRSRVDLEYAHVGVEDDDPEGDIRVILDECVAWVGAAVDAGGAVLVHCMEGKSRSVCVCAAHLCVNLGYGLEAAMALIRERRPETDVYPRYARQLAEYVEAR